MDADQTRRYLHLLELPARPPSLPALGELVAAHLARIPFENVSKLLRHARGEAPVLESLDDFLDRSLQLRLGGTCYACACHLNDLLRSLGYEASLCGAAMDAPDVHAVNVVAVAGREVLVDVGYGAPLAGPLFLDATAPQRVIHGDEEYRLHPRDGHGRSRLEHRRQGELVHGYTLDPTPRDASHFAPVIAHSYRPDAAFLNRLRIVRHDRQRSVSVRNLEVRVIEGDAIRARRLPGREALRDVVMVLLQIPGEVLDEALDVLGDRLHAT